MKKRLLTSSDFMEGRRDETLFHIANHLVRGGMPQGEIEELIDLIAEKICVPPFPKNEAREKVSSALKRGDRREKSIAEEVRDFIVTSNGWFLTSESFNRLHLTSREEKKAAVLALLRLKEEGVIERHGEKNGCYRRIETDFEDIDFQDEGGEEKPLLLPFRIERFTEFYEKGIIVIAGEPDSGKTAFLLETIRLNMNRLSMFYLSSEFSKRELNKRLKKFGLPLDQWKFKSQEMAANYGDQIRPDAINLVDFLELTGEPGREFYAVGGMLKRIFDRLQKGMAIVAIQKNWGADLGRGGIGSLEKPRLYLSMGNNKIKIIKCKNWRDETFNPNRLELNYKLVSGCKFIPEGDWSKPVDTPNLYHETPNQYKFARKKLGKEDLVKEFQRRFGE
jgi:hypothetical protein